MMGTVRSWSMSAEKKMARDGGWIVTGQSITEDLNYLIPKRVGCPTVSPERLPHGGTAQWAQTFLIAAATTPAPSPRQRATQGCHRPVAALLLSGGQHGQHNHSDYRRRYTFGSRRWLVRTRRLELGSTASL